MDMTVVVILILIFVIIMNFIVLMMPPVSYIAGVVNNFERGASFKFMITSLCDIRRSNIYGRVDAWQLRLLMLMVDSLLLVVFGWGREEEG